MAGGRRFHLAQFGENRVETGPRLRERSLCGEFAIARALDLRSQRFQSLVETGDRRRQRVALGCDARDVFRRLRGLALERFAARQRGRVVGFFAREIATPPLPFRPQFFQLQFLAIDARANVR